MKRYIVFLVLAVFYVLSDANGAAREDEVAKRFSTLPVELQENVVNQIPFIEAARFRRESSFSVTNEEIAALRKMPAGRLIQLLFTIEDILKELLPVKPEDSLQHLTPSQEKALRSYIVRSLEALSYMRSSYDPASGRYSNDFSSEPPAKPTEVEILNIHFFPTGILRTIGFSDTSGDMRQKREKVQTIVNNILGHIDRIIETLPAETQDKLLFIRKCKISAVDSTRAPSYIGDSSIQPIEIRIPRFIQKMRYLESFFAQVPIVVRGIYLDELIKNKRNGALELHSGLNSKDIKRLSSELAEKRYRCIAFQPSYNRDFPVLTCPAGKELGITVMTTESHDLSREDFRDYREIVGSSYAVEDAEEAMKMRLKKEELDSRDGYPYESIEATNFHMGHGPLKGTTVIKHNYGVDTRTLYEGRLLSPEEVSQIIRKKKLSINKRKFKDGEFRDPNTQVDAVKSQSGSRTSPY